MFIDFLTLVMINLVAGTVVLAYYLWRGIDERDQRGYAAAFFGIGLVGLLTGLQISFNWPLPGAYNVGYGDATTLFGVVFLTTSIALYFGSSLIPVSIYAFFAAIDGLIVGARIWSLQITQEPPDFGGRLHTGRPLGAGRLPVPDVVPGKQDGAHDRRTAATGHGAGLGRDLLWITVGTHGQLCQVGAGDDEQVNCRRVHLGRALALPKSFK